MSGSCPACARRRTSCIVSRCVWPDLPPPSAPRSVLLPSHWSPRICKLLTLQLPAESDHRMCRVMRSLDAHARSGNLTL